MTDSSLVIGRYQWSWNPRTDALALGEALHALIEGPDQAPITTGAAFVERLHPADRDRHAEAMRAHFAGRRRFECASRLLCADGQLRWVFMAGAAVRRRGTRIDTILGTLRQLSASDRWEEGTDDSFSQILSDVWTAGIAAIEERETEQARRLRAEAETTSQREFLATISHEIRNPLSVILANVDLLSTHADHAGDTAMRERLGALRRASSHLRELVTDVLDLAKADAGRVELDLDWFALDELLFEVEDMGIALTQQSDVLFILDAPAEAGRMYSDRLKLKQVLLNLISNASKFTEQGRITLRVTDGPEGLVFAVEDTGIGIPSDKLETLFKAFSQVGGPRSRRAVGTGLGLYISERYVRMLGGRMSVTSREGEGSIFDFGVPRLIAPASSAIPRVRDEHRLVVGHTEDVTTLDPHVMLRSTDYTIARHQYDSLMLKDAKGGIVPGLAERWEPFGEVGWRFHLRRGVRFHDGSLFDARDVIATFDRVGRGTGYAAFVRQIVTIRSPDPYVLELETAAPSPLLPVDLSHISIIHRDHRDAEAADFDQLRIANGTGPFRLKARDGNTGLLFEAYGEHWQGPSPWREVEFRLIDENGMASITALLAGEVDLIDNVTPDQLVELQARDDVGLASCDTNRVWYLFFDQVNDQSPWVTDRQGQPLDRNPLKDPRVRRAMSLAIDREFITQQIMAGQARPVGDLAGPSVFGVNPDLHPDPHDPARARVLLREAGYPDGFGLTIHGSRDRSFNGPSTLRAIALMLSAVGINCRPMAVEGHEYYRRASRGEFSVGLSGWGSVTGETSYSLRMLLASRDPDRGLGSVNRGGYSNPDLDRLVVAALETMDAQARLDLLRRASAIAMRDAAIVPICYRRTTWAFKPGLDYNPQADGATLAMEVSRA